jgi:hypothetical protein
MHLTANQTAPLQDRTKRSAVMRPIEPVRTFFLVGSEAEREAFEAGFYDYHWQHYVVLVAGTGNRRDSGFAADF